MAFPVPPVFTLLGGFKYTFDTARLYFQAMSIEEHLENYHGFWSNPANLVTLGANPKKSIEDSLAQMTTQINSPERPFLEAYAIFLKAPGENGTHPFVGLVGVIREMSDAPEELGVNGAGEFGYMIESIYQAQGYGSEAVKGYLDFYWSMERRRSNQKLVACVNASNIGSLKVIEQVGGKNTAVEKNGGFIYIVERPKK